MKKLNVWITERTAVPGLILSLVCALLLVGVSTVKGAQAAGDAWVLKETNFGADTYTYWDYWWGDSHVEYTVTLAISQHTVQEKVTKAGQVTQNARFYFDYDTPPAELITGNEVSLQATGSSQGPYKSASEIFYFLADTWIHDGQRVSEIGGMHLELDSGHQSSSGALQFSVPETFNGHFIIKSRVSIGAPFHVQWIYEPGAAQGEGFILTNTGSGEVTLNDVPVPPCSRSLQGTDRDLPKASGDCEVPIEDSDRLEMKPKSKVRISLDCFFTVLNVLEVVIFRDLEEDLYDLEEDGSQLPFARKIFVTFITILEDPTICEDFSSQINQRDGGNHISLGLQSGAGRFKPALTNLALDIETDSVKVRSFAKNDFAVGHNPDTNLTIAACYKGSVTINPANPALASVTLTAGKKIEVTRDSIGPVTRIPQRGFLPSLLLLRGE